jgi:putative intracellular protease/amidase
VFDLASNPVSLALIQSFAAAKKPIAAVCHGPAALMNATAPSGVPLLQSASVTGFSNLEEEQMGTANVMPFMLETELNRITGGGYVKADQPLGEKVVVSKTAETGAPLITGQNPASTPGVARELLKALGL